MYVNSLGRILCIAIDNPQAGMYLPSEERKIKLPPEVHSYSNTSRRKASGPIPAVLRSCIPPILTLILSAGLLVGCQQHNRLEEQKTRTLTPDERYLIELYMKITEFEENLQDNPELAEEKREDLREEIDIERIKRVLDELEQDPKRWLAIYNRIHELKRRRAPDSPN